MNAVSGSSVRVVAPAKVNLWLSVGGHRPDGYHDLVSVMQAVSLSDEVTIAPHEALELEVEPSGAAPEDASNLASRAAVAMRAATGVYAGAAIRVRKRIPMGAGLGGGSADAAATLVGLNELWRTGLSRKALQRMGAHLGADVPFCVRGTTAIARGTGADLSPLACPRALWWVLAGTGRQVSTAEVYEAFDLRGTPSLDEPAELADALARGDLDAIARWLRNDLTDAALAVAPDIALARDALTEAGALGVVMTGSGSAWCGLARDEADARAIASGLPSTAVRWSTVARSLDHGARIER